MVSSFQFDTTGNRSDLMKKIRSKNTKPELLLRKSISKLDLRYRLNVANLPGKPDLVFRKYKLVIFVDGEFWHGYNWSEKKNRIKSNRDYWIFKIEKNISRDNENNMKLAILGFKVIRFWEHQIKNNIEDCLSIITTHIRG